MYIYLLTVYCLIVSASVKEFMKKKKESLLLLMRLSELCFVNGDILVIFYHLNFPMSHEFLWLFVWVGCKPMWVLITD